MQELGPHNAYWCDDEWHSWDDFGPPEDMLDGSRLAELEYEAELRHRFPKADITLVPYLRGLLEMAEDYFSDTGRHLSVYGDIGELFGAVVYGIELHRNFAKGSDGRLGNDFVEIKTITPFKKSARVEVRLDRHFSKLLVVRIDGEFRISGHMIERNRLPGGSGRKLRIAWDGLRPFGGGSNDTPQFYSAASM